MHFYLHIFYHLYFSLSFNSSYILQYLSYLSFDIFPFSIALFIPHFSSFICVQPKNSHSWILFLNSLNFVSNSLLSTSVISKLENPGVSAIYVSSSNSYNFVSVVVFFPFLFFLLISPSSVLFSPNKAFIVLDFPTPEFPENTLVFPFNFSFSF